jgi:mannosyltransferase OCH1-like enzyme
MVPLEEKYSVKSDKMDFQEPQHFVTYFTIKINEKDHIPKIIDDNLFSFEKNSNYSVPRFFNNDNCLAFLQKHFSDQIVQAYLKLKAKAYRSDLWRLCVLYKLGGLYTDISLKCVGDITFFRNYDVVLCQDLNSSDIFNAVMYFKKPKNKFLLFCIEKIAEIIFREEYGKNILDITGPTRLGKLFREYYGRMPKEGENNFSGLKLLHLKIHRTIPLSDVMNPGVQIRNGKTVLLERHAKYNSTRDFFSKGRTNRYFNLWKRREVYYKIPKK